MRRKLFLILALFTALSISANAAITVQEQTDAEYLINNGFSESFAEEVMISKKRIAGEPAEPLYDKRHGKFVNFWLRAYSYLDPSIDYADERCHHDVKLSPSYTDL